MLSIIIPTYNSEAVIGRALDSIVHQSFGGFEVLVMDGDSSDGTSDIVLGYHDSRIAFYSEPDNGIYDAMNKGIVKSRGSWLYFMGSDDYLVDRYGLQTIFNRNLDNVDVLYGDVESNHLSVCYKGEWSVDKIDYNRCHQAIFYRREVFDKMGLYNIKYSILADYDLNIRCYFSNSIRLQYVNIVIAHYSEQGVSDRCKDPEFEKDYAWVILKYGFGKLSINQKITYLKIARINSGSYYRKSLLSIIIWVLIVFRKLFRIVRESSLE